MWISCANGGGWNDDGWNWLQEINPSNSVSRWTAEDQQLWASGELANRSISPVVATRAMPWSPRKATSQTRKAIDASCTLFALRHAATACWGCGWALICKLTSAKWNNKRNTNWNIWPKSCSLLVLWDALTWVSSTTGPNSDALGIQLSKLPTTSKAHSPQALVQRNAHTCSYHLVPKCEMLGAPFSSQTPISMEHGREEFQPQEANTCKQMLSTPGMSSTEAFKNRILAQAAAA